MATSNSRDVKMTLSVETLGAEDIKKLQTSVATLAKEGGDAAPEFQKLADEIGRLGEQASALQAFQQLADETGTLATRQEQAALTAAELKLKLDALTANTQDAVAKQQALVAEQSQAVARAKELRDSYDLLSATTDRAGKKTDDYKEKIKDLKVAKIDQRAEVERLSAELSKATEGVRQAEAAEVQLSVAYKRAADTAVQAANALQANTASVEQAASAAREMGVATDNVAAAQAELVQGLNTSGRAAETLAKQVDELAATERALAAAKPFEKLAEEAQQLVSAGNAVSVFDQALAELTVRKQAVAAQNNTGDWQKEAAAIVDAAEAAQKLTKQTELLVATERELKAQAAFEKQAQDARNLVQAGEYVRFWREELDKAEQQAQQTANAAGLVDDAFKNLGVRGVQELRAEIGKVRDAMEVVRSTAGQTGAGIAGAMAAGEAKVKDLEREIRSVEGTLTMSDKAARLFSNSMGQITAGNIIADAVGYLVNKVKELGAAFLGAIVDGDQMRRGLNAIYKDAGITAAQIEFLRRASSESGVAFGQLSGEFVKFSASMKMSNIPLEQSNDLFRAVTAATAALGLGTEATSGTLNALGQMASKGTVSLEELRAQLGDRLPGAMGLTAKGLGITEAELVKLVEAGGLATRDFIVPFTKALGELKGESDGLVPAFDRLKGTLTEVAQGMGDAGATSILTGTLKVLGGFVASLALGLSTLVEGLFLVGSAAVATAASLRGDTKAWEFFGDQVEKSRVRLTGQADALNAFLDPSAAAAASTAAHADAMTVNTAEIVKNISANTSLSAVQKLTALSTALAGDATLDASAKIVQYAVASGALLKQQEAQTDAYGKSAKAAKQQGDTLVELAKLTGDATLIQNASIAAAELNAVAQDKLAASQAAETVILVSQKAEIEASATARGLSADQIKVQIDALDKLIVKSQSETEQAAQANAAAKAALFERTLAVEALKNHSAEIDKFKAAMELAVVTLKEYERLALNGKKTEDDVAAARLALTRATVLYKDAVSDSIQALDLETRAKQASLQLSITQSNTAQQHSAVLAAQARAIGDTTTATFYDIQAREQAIVTVKLQMQMAALEAEAALKTIELKRLEIDGTTELGKKKLAILDIEAALIKVKLAGNEAAKETIKGIENEITALRNGTDARSGHTSGIHSDTAARGSNTAAIYKQVAALEALNEKYSKPGGGSTVSTSGGDRSKFLAGQSAQDLTNQFSLLEKIQKGTLGAADLENAKAVLASLRVNNQTNRDLDKMGGAFSVAGAQDRAKWETVQAQLQNFISVQESASRATGTKAPTAVQAANTTQTVNINIGGRSTAVNVVSSSDAAALTAILRQLESGKGTSS